jgi:hypothetical protein
LLFHLPVRGKVKDGSSDEVGDDMGAVSLPVDVGGGLEKSNIHIE